MNLTQEFFIADVQPDGTIIIHAVAVSPATALRKRQQLLPAIPDPRILRLTDKNTYVDVTEGATEK